MTISSVSIDQTITPAVTLCQFKENVLLFFFFITKKKKNPFNVILKKKNFLIQKRKKEEEKVHQPASKHTGFSNTI